MSDNPQFGARANEVAGQYGPPDDPDSRPYGVDPVQPNEAANGLEQQSSFRHGRADIEGDESGYQPAQMPAQPGYQPAAPAQPGYQPAQMPAYPQGSGMFPLVKLPGRGGPIATIVVSLLLIFVVPIIVFGVTVVSAYSKFDVESIERNMIHSGDVVQVSQSGVFILSVPNENSRVTCVMLSADNNQALPDQSKQQDGLSLFTWKSLGSGSYTVECKTDEGKPFTGKIAAMDEAQVMEFASPVINSLMAPTVIALIGVVLLIVGIVWLVKVNRKRRAIRFGMGL